MNSLLNILDMLLGKFLSAIIYGLMCVILFTIAAVSLFSIPIIFFEDTFAISELDIIEIGMVITLIATIWRFFKRGRMLQLSWWKLIKRLVFVLAITGLIAALIEYLALILELEEKGRVGSEFLNVNSDLINFYESIAVILAIYAGTPLPEIWNKQDYKFNFWKADLGQKSAQQNKYHSNNSSD